MMFLLRLVFLVALVQSGRALTSKFKDCGSSAGAIESLEISPCDTSPCTLYKGENATIQIKFTTKQRLVEAKAFVHGIIARIPIPFALPDSSVCNYVQPSCPLLPEKGPYTYEFKLFVKKVFPSIKLKIRWEFKTENQDELICAEFPAQLASRSADQRRTTSEEVPMMKLTQARRRSWP